MRLISLWGNKKEMYSKFVIVCLAQNLELNDERKKGETQNVHTKEQDRLSIQWEPKPSEKDWLWPEKGHTLREESSQRIRNRGLTEEGTGMSLLEIEFNVQLCSSLPTLSLFPEPRAKTSLLFAANLWQSPVQSVF